MVTLPDGSRAYFPADGTALWGTEVAEDLPFPVLTTDAVRKLRLLVETLQSRRDRGVSPSK